ncbi:MAG: hypothetical protein MJA83_09045 [Gammaproteobacteria bacterium]|nr:hypothetical protein [Gammaproteobacteria bacterium]
MADLERLFITKDSINPKNWISIDALKERLPLLRIVNYFPNFAGQMTM